MHSEDGIRGQQPANAGGFSKLEKREGLFPWSL